jgi:hypothetical protein
VASPGAGSVGRSSVVNTWTLRQAIGHLVQKTITMPVAVNRNRDIRRKISVLGGIILTVDLVNRAKGVFVLLVFVE